MKAVKFLFSVMTIALLATACGGGDEPESSQTFTTTNTFLAVTETDHYSTSLYDGGETTAKVSIGVGADLTIKNFRTYSSEVPSELLIPGLKYEIRGENLNISGKNITPKINGSTTSKYFVENVEVNIYSGKNMPLFFDANINLGDYIVQTFYKKYYFSGTTRVQNEATSAMFNDDEIGYVFNLDPATFRLSIDLKGAKFDEKMPMRMDMTFPDIPFVVKSHVIEAECAEIIPTIGGKPYPSYQIKDLSFDLNPESGITSNLRFTMYNERLGEYSVFATLNY